ncbi:hypothetical protein UlMin_032194 [Ulmus minor]
MPYMSDKSTGTTKEEVDFAEFEVDDLKLKNIPPIEVEDLNSNPTNENEPTTYEEAIKRRQAKKWKEAMKEEISSLQKNAKWKLVPRLKDQKIVDCKWIFKIKEGASKSKSMRFKTRLVAKGFTQR